MSSMGLAAPSTLATGVGRQVVSAGGTAVDAAVAMALTAMCTEPGVCAPGGGGFLTIDPADGAPVVVDGYMAVPGLGFEGGPETKTITMEYGGGVTTGVGPGSIAVPGSFAALELAWSRYGEVPWAELMGLVADTVAAGFPLSQACRIYLVDSGPLSFSDDPVVRGALYEGERLKDVGENVRFDDLADSLRQIGEEGARTFYEGDLASRMIDDLAARGSMLTAADLAAYEAVARDPLIVEVGGWDVVANPPPAVGGMTVLGAVHHTAEAEDPLDPQTWLTALSEVFGKRERLGPMSAELMLKQLGLVSPSTITVSAVDTDGIAVAATFSAGYGSGVVPEGTGILMNNSIGEFELIPGGVESLVPGERMMSNMAPTTLRSGSDVVAIGSPGADRITSALAITLIRFLLSDDRLHEAVEHPRLHPESVDPLAVAAEIGLDLDGDVRWYPEPHMFFGGVNAAGLIGGELVAHADSRRVGSTVIV